MKMIDRRRFIHKSVKAGIGSYMIIPVFDSNNGIPSGNEKESNSGITGNEANKRRNIIFLQTDQQRWDAIGINNPHIKTPNLDRLAQKGVLFNQATCQAPMCIPSRNSMMFGLYPSELGIRSNLSHSTGDKNMPWEPIPGQFRKAGYQTAGFGKTHWGRTDEPIGTRGFETRVVGVKALGLEAGAIHYQDDENPEGLAAYKKEVASYGAGEEGAQGYIGATSQVAERDHPDGWVAEKCLEFLENRVDPDRPLFLYLSFTNPHAGMNVPKRFEDIYDIKTIPDTLQPPWKDEPDTHLAYCDRENKPLAYFSATRYKQWREAWEKMSVLERRRTTLRYYADCSWMDYYFGQVLERLDKLGRLKNALIVYTSDHGEMLGERNFRFSKYCLYESSVRVPILLSGSIIPENIRGIIDDRPAELVDLYPTMLNAAGINFDSNLPGLDLLSNQKHKGSFCEFHDSGAPAYMWRTEKWKLIMYMDRPLVETDIPVDQIKGELYDLENDPHEWQNVYSDPRYSSVREQFKTELLMHLASVWSKYPVGKG
jgi:arylsulfatase A-like enzyme